MYFARGLLLTAMLLLSLLQVGLPVPAEVWRRAGGERTLAQRRGEEHGLQCTHRLLYIKLSRSAYHTCEGCTCTLLL